MVRLLSTNTVENGNGGSLNPHVLDQLYASTPSSNSGNKRARTAAGSASAGRGASGNTAGTTSGSTISSLNYKVRGPGANRGGSNTNDGIDYNDIVLPVKGVSSYEQQQRQMKQQQQQQNTNQQQQMDRSKGLMTRSRGSGGIPPKKTKLELLAELQGMTEEQIMTAFYNDPELAEVATEHITRVQQQQKKEQQQKKQQQQQQRSKYQKSSSSSGSAGSTGGGSTKFKRGSTDRIDAAMKEKGIPYEQWAVILALISIGSYYIYKAVKGPPEKTNQRMPLSTAKKSKGGKKKGSNNNTGSVNTAVATAKRSEDVDKVAAEIEAISTSNTVNASSTVPTSDVGGSKKPLKKKVNKSLTLSKDSVVDVGSLKSNGKSQKSKGAIDKALTTAPTSATTSEVKSASIRHRGVISADDYVTDDDDAIDNAWKTVSSSKANSGHATIVVAASAEAKTVHSTDTTTKTEDVNNKKQKKKKAKQIVSTAATTTTEILDTQAPAVAETAVTSAVEETSKTVFIEKENSVTNAIADDTDVVNQEAIVVNNDDIEKENVLYDSTVSNPANGTNKKSKKKKNDPNASAANGGATSKKNGFGNNITNTDAAVAADAAYALQLQKEEEEFSKMQQKQEHSLAAAAGVIKASAAVTSSTLSSSDIGFESNMNTANGNNTLGSDDDVWKDVFVKKKK